MKVLLICFSQDEIDVLGVIAKQANLQSNSVYKIETALNRWDNYLPDMVIIENQTVQSPEQLTLLREHTPIPIILITLVSAKSG